MAHPEKGSVAQQIGTLFEGGSVAGLTDRQLLERFNSRRDAAGEAAFAALVCAARADGAGRLPPAPR